MNRKMVVLITGPIIAIGLLLLAVCFASAWYIHKLQDNLSSVLKETVSSLKAAQNLEITVRQIRFHRFLSLTSPSEALDKRIEEDEYRFQIWLESAKEVANTEKEVILVQKIVQGYQNYRKEFQLLSGSFKGSPIPSSSQVLAFDNAVNHVVHPCHEFLKVNETQMQEAIQESEDAGLRLRLGLIILGLGGSLGGILSGYGIAWSMSRSLYRLQVRIQDMAQHLEHPVASVRLAQGGDLGQLDEQMQHILEKVEEVTDRIQRQQRELIRAEQLATLGHLAASVAHEIRNPLTAMKMLVGVALRNAARGGLSEKDLQVLHEEIGNLEQTVQNLLDFARLPNPRPLPCYLRDVVQQALDLVRVRSQQQNVSIQIHFPECPILMEIDRGQMSMVLVNLFLNSLDAMPDGGLLEIEVDRIAPHELQIRVSDNGSGIPPELLDQLFTPFATSKPKGTGLGLSISRTIIEAHGGTINVSNRSEGGASFLITLPFKEVKNAETFSN